MTDVIGTVVLQHDSKILTARYIRFLSKTRKNINRYATLVPAVNTVNTLTEYRNQHISMSV